MEKKSPSEGAGGGKEESKCGSWWWKRRVQAVRAGGGNDESKCGSWWWKRRVQVRELVVEKKSPIVGAGGEKEESLYLIRISAPTRQNWLSYAGFDVERPR